MTEALTATLDAIDAVNETDPNQEFDGGQAVAKELLYSRRMSDQLMHFYPNAPEILQIAARAQHIGRWRIPRSDYPMDKTGYKQWRTELGKFHADTTARIMADCGYSSEDQEKIKALLTKQRLKSDPLVQALEDVICLVFIKHYLDDFAGKHEHAKLIDIIQKTWRKMSKLGQAAALQLPLSEESQALIAEALA